MTSFELVTTGAIKIATLNLFNYLEPPGAYYDFQNIYSQEQWLKKQAWIANYLNLYQPDMIGFQEVFSSKSLQALCLAQGYSYFSVLDEPEVEDEFIYRKPVVAIASRFPIVASKCLQAEPSHVELLGLHPDFDYSRAPLCATVSLPIVGEVDCYVVHFKSKRPQLDTHSALQQNKSLLSGEEASIRYHQEVLGRWGASMRRGSEAALIYSEIIQQRQMTGRPFLLLGDFNDEMNSDVLSALSHQYSRVQQLSSKVLALYALKDSFSLYQTTDHCSEAVQRQPTHYYGANGSVLDYIMCSCEFDAGYDQSIFEVSDYHSHDSHLLRPEYAVDSHSSDHAPVMITLQPRR
ncbi:endonuclease/exonuclease/phosphatase family protein [Shewanella gelidii]|uniref:Endonuclease n=1 Tax=Shewanella gelidii TaxID=1642821 RepID=A0A917N6G7_9GAMM|nr:endonuclease/exonuclease/phosphatase family protein [Shewanella gelidii]MCL1096904.1 endonuclease/exonuclease/phosphatase family protein [Shewanella gelidii]GGI71053.1 endonuclease [Shewanella gelidii]